METSSKELLTMGAKTSIKLLKQELEELNKIYNRTYDAKIDLEVVLKKYKEENSALRYENYKLKMQVDVQRLKLENIKLECEQAPAIDSELSLRIREIIESENNGNI